VGERQTEARKDKKGTGDPAREPAPCGDLQDVRRDQLQEAQIPAEMVDDHRDDREAAGNVDGVPALE